jgi:hypothetical protein
LGVARQRDDLAVGVGVRRGIPVDGLPTLLRVEKRVFKHWSSFIMALYIYGIRMIQCIKKYVQLKLWTNFLASSFLFKGESGERWSSS